MSENTHRGVGRPPNLDGRRLTIRINEPQLENIRAAAALADEDVSLWVRTACEERIQRMGRAREART